MTACYIKFRDIPKLEALFSAVDELVVQDRPSFINPLNEQDIVDPGSNLCALVVGVHVPSILSTVCPNS